MNKVFGGHEKEPKSAHGGGRMGKGGKRPVVHSHSAKPHRKISVGKRGMK